MDQIIYSWKFSDKKERSHMWYMIMLSIVIGIVIWGFVTAQYGLSFVILLASGILFYVENNSDEEVTIEISDIWIKIANTFYEYAKIRSFSFLYSGSNAVFVRLMVTKGNTLRPIDVDVNNQIVKNLKLILPNFLIEDEKQELTWTDKLIRLLNL